MFNLNQEDIRMLNPIIALKSIIIFFLFLVLCLSSLAQVDYRTKYFLSVGGNHSRYHMDDRKLSPMLLPSIGLDLIHYYSKHFGINAGTRYSYKGSKSSKFSLHSHYNDFFVAPRYVISPTVSAELGFQFSNLLYQETRYPDKTLENAGMGKTQFEVYTGLSFNISKDVSFNLRYTIPGNWMDHSNLSFGLSFKILPRNKTANTSFGSLDEALENQLACRKLILHRQGIELLPAEIGMLVYMEELFLDGNELEMLPASIGELENLKFLFLRNNHLKQLPAEIGKLSQLEELDLRYNQLTNLPEEIGNLKSLKFLNLQNNFISEIPPEIGNLQSLIELDVSNNSALMTLPAEINQLRNLEKLIISSHTLLPLPFTPASSKLQVIVR